MAIQITSRTQLTNTFGSDLFHFPEIDYGYYAWENDIYNIDFNTVFNTAAGLFPYNSSYNETLMFPSWVIIHNDDGKYSQDIFQINWGEYVHQYNYHESGNDHIRQESTYIEVEKVCDIQTLSVLTTTEKECLFDSMGWYTSDWSYSESDFDLSVTPRHKYYVSSGIDYLYWEAVNTHNEEKTVDIPVTYGRLTDSSIGVGNYSKRPKFTLSVVKMYFPLNPPGENSDVYWYNNDFKYRHVIIPVCYIMDPPAIKACTPSISVSSVPPLSAADPEPKPITVNIPYISRDLDYIDPKDHYNKSARNETMWSTKHYAFPDPSKDMYYSTYIARDISPFGIQLRTGSVSGAWNYSQAATILKTATAESSTGYLVAGKYGYVPANNLFTFNADANPDGFNRYFGIATYYINSIEVSTGSVSEFNNGWKPIYSNDIVQLGDGNKCNIDWVNTTYDMNNIPSYLSSGVSDNYYTLSSAVTVDTSLGGSGTGTYWARGIVGFTEADIAGFTNPAEMAQYLWGEAESNPEEEGIHFDTNIFNKTGSMGTVLSSQSIKIPINDKLSTRKIAIALKTTYTEGVQGQGETTKYNLILLTIAAVKLEIVNTERITTDTSGPRKWLLSNVDAEGETYALQFYSSNPWTISKNSNKISLSASSGIASTSNTDYKTVNVTIAETTNLEDDGMASYILNFIPDSEGEDDPPIIATLTIKQNYGSGISLVWAMGESEGTDPAPETRENLSPYGSAIIDPSGNMYRVRLNSTCAWKIKYYGIAGEYSDNYMAKASINSSGYQIKLPNGTLLNEGTRYANKHTELIVTIPPASAKSGSKNFYKMIIEYADKSSVNTSLTLKQNFAELVYQDSGTTVSQSFPSSEGDAAFDIYASTKVYCGILKKGSSVIENWHTYNPTTTIDIDTISFRIPENTDPINNAIHALYFVMTNNPSAGTPSTNPNYYTSSNVGNNKQYFYSTTMVSGSGTSDPSAKIIQNAAAKENNFKVLIPSTDEPSATLPTQWRDYTTTIGIPRDGVTQSLPKYLCIRNLGNVSTVYTIIQNYDWLIPFSYYSGSGQWKDTPSSITIPPDGSLYIKYSALENDSTTARNGTMTINNSDGITLTVSFTQYSGQARINLSGNTSTVNYMGETRTATVSNQGSVSQALSIYGTDCTVTPESVDLAAQSSRNLSVVIPENRSIFKKSNITVYAQSPNAGLQRLVYEQDAYDKPFVNIIGEILNGSTWEPLNVSNTVLPGSKLRFTLSFPTNTNNKLLWNLDNATSHPEYTHIEGASATSNPQTQTQFTVDIDSDIPENDAISIILTITTYYDENYGVSGSTSYVASFPFYIASNIVADLDITNYDSYVIQEGNKYICLFGPGTGTRSLQIEANNGAMCNWRVTPAVNSYLYGSCQPTTRSYATTVMLRTVSELVRGESYSKDSSATVSGIPSANPVGVGNLPIYSYRYPLPKLYINNVDDAELTAELTYGNSITFNINTQQTGRNGEILTSQFAVDTDNSEYNVIYTDTTITVFAPSLISTQSIKKCNIKITYNYPGAEIPDHTKDLVKYIRLTTPAAVRPVLTIDPSSRAMEGGNTTGSDRILQVNVDTSENNFPIYWYVDKVENGTSGNEFNIIKYDDYFTINFPTNVNMQSKNCTVSVRYRYLNCSENIEYVEQGIYSVNPSDIPIFNVDPGNYTFTPDGLTDNGLDYIDLNISAVHPQGWIQPDASVMWNFSKVETGTSGNEFKLVRDYNTNTLRIYPPYNAYRNQDKKCDITFNYYYKGNIDDIYTSNVYSYVVSSPIDPVFELNASQLISDNAYHLGPTGTLSNIFTITTHTEYSNPYLGIVWTYTKEEIGTSGNEFKVTRSGDTLTVLPPVNPYTDTDKQCNLIFTYYYKGDPATVYTYKMNGSEIIKNIADRAEVPGIIVPGERERYLTADGGVSDYYDVEISSTVSYEVSPLDIIWNFTKDEHGTTGNEFKISKLSDDYGNPNRIRIIPPVNCSTTTEKRCDIAITFYYRANPSEVRTTDTFAYIVDHAIEPDLNFIPVESPILTPDGSTFVVEITNANPNQYKLSCHDLDVAWTYERMETNTHENEFRLMQSGNTMTVTAPANASATEPKQCVVNYICYYKGATNQLFDSALYTYEVPFATTPDVSVDIPSDPTVSVSDGNVTVDANGKSILVTVFDTNTDTYHQSALDLVWNYTVAKTNTGEDEFTIKLDSVIDQDDKTGISGVVYRITMPANHSTKKDKSCTVTYSCYFKSNPDQVFVSPTPYTYTVTKATTPSLSINPIENMVSADGSTFEIEVIPTEYYSNVPVVWTYSKEVINAADSEFKLIKNGNTLTVIAPTNTFTQKEKECNITFEYSYPNGDESWTTSGHYTVLPAQTPTIDISTVGILPADGSTFDIGVEVTSGNYSNFGTYWNYTKEEIGTSGNEFKITKDASGLHVESPKNPSTIKQRECIITFTYGYKNGDEVWEEQRNYVVQTAQPLDLIITPDSSTVNPDGHTITVDVSIDTKGQDLNASWSYTKTETGTAGNEFRVVRTEDGLEITTPINTSTIQQKECTIDFKYSYSVYSSADEEIFYTKSATYFVKTASGFNITLNPSNKTWEAQHSLEDSLSIDVSCSSDDELGISWTYSKEEFGTTGNEFKVVRNGDKLNIEIIPQNDSLTSIKSCTITAVAYYTADPSYQISTSGNYIVNAAKAPSISFAGNTLSESKTILFGPDSSYIDVDIYTIPDESTPAAKSWKLNIEDTNIVYNDRIIGNVNNISGVFDEYNHSNVRITLNDNIDIESIEKILEITAFNGKDERGNKIFLTITQSGYVDYKPTAAVADARVMELVQGEKYNIGIPDYNPSSFSDETVYNKITIPNKNYTEVLDYGIAIKNAQSNKYTEIWNSTYADRIIKTKSSTSTTDLQTITYNVSLAGTNQVILLKPDNKYIYYTIAKVNYRKGSSDPKDWIMGEIVTSELKQFTYPKNIDDEDTETIRPYFKPVEKVKGYMGGCEVKNFINSKAITFNRSVDDSLVIVYDFTNCYEKVNNTLRINLTEALVNRILHDANFNKAWEYINDPVNINNAKILYIKNVIIPNIIIDNKIKVDAYMNNNVSGLKLVNNNAGMVKLENISMRVEIAADASKILVLENPENHSYYLKAYLTY